MNTKPLLYLSSFLALTLTTATLNAGPHRGRNHSVSKQTRTSGGRSFVGGNRFVGGGNRVGSWNGQHVNRQRFASGQNLSVQRWNGQHWNTNHWSNNWNWNHHRRRNVVFVDFG